MTDHVDATKVATTPTSRSSEQYVPVVGDRPEGTDVWLRVPYDPDDYGPVSDFATDFDHADPAYNPIAPKVWKELREGGCPVAHSDRYGGMWVPLTHDTVNAIAYDTESFTSRAVVVTVGRPGDLAMPAPIGGAPPITSDPPFHGMARRLLLPAFAPKQIEPWEPEVRRLCRDLLDRLTDITPGETVIDAAIAYAQNIPVNVIGRMLGFPAEDEHLFRKFVHDVLERIAEDPTASDGFDDLGDYIRAQVEDHRANPRDDLTSYLLTVELDGQPINDDIVGGMIILLLVAGVDTTWSAIGSSLWHLAQHPDDQKRLVDDPEVMKFALEEFLRAVRTGHHGSLGREGHRLLRVSDEEGRLRAASLPRSQPRSSRVRGSGQVHHRPRREPPRGLRARNPPLPRVEPRPARAQDRDRGVGRSLPAVRAGWRRALERGPGPRTA